MTYNKKRTRNIVDKFVELFTNGKEEYYSYHNTEVNKPTGHRSYDVIKESRLKEESITQKDYYSKWCDINYDNLREAFSKLNPEIIHSTTFDDFCQNIFKKFSKQSIENSIKKDENKYKL